MRPTPRAISTSVTGPPERSSSTPRGYPLRGSAGIPRAHRDPSTAARENGPPGRGLIQRLGAAGGPPPRRPAVRPGTHSPAAGVHAGPGVQADGLGPGRAPVVDVSSRGARRRPVSHQAASVRRVCRQGDLGLPAATPQSVRLPLRRIRAVRVLGDVFSLIGGQVRIERNQDVPLDVFHTLEYTLTRALTVRV